MGSPELARSDSGPVAALLNRRVRPRTHGGVGERQGWPSLPPDRRTKELGPELSRSRSVNGKNLALRSRLGRDGCTQDFNQCLALKARRDKYRDADACNQYRIVGRDPQNISNVRRRNRLL